VVFSSSSSCRETAKNATKKSRREKTTGGNKIPQLFWPKAFDMDSPKKVLYGVLELPLLRNAQKRHKKISQKKILAIILVAICQIYAAFSFVFFGAP
jgi:hypothetical protein